MKRKLLKLNVPLSTVVPSCSNAYSSATEILNSKFLHRTAIPKFLG